MLTIICSVVFVVFFARWILTIVAGCIGMLLGGFFTGVGVGAATYFVLGYVLQIKPKDDSEPTNKEEC